MLTDPEGLWAELWEVAAPQRAPVQRTDVPSLGRRLGSPAGRTLGCSVEGRLELGMCVQVTQSL